MVDTTADRQFDWGGRENVRRRRRRRWLCSWLLFAYCCCKRWLIFSASFESCLLDRKSRRKEREKKLYLLFFCCCCCCSWLCLHARTAHGCGPMSPYVWTAALFYIYKTHTQVQSLSVYTLHIYCSGGITVHTHTRWPYNIIHPTYGHLSFLLHYTHTHIFKSTHISLRFPLWSALMLRALTIFLFIFILEMTMP